MDPYERVKIADALVPKTYEIGDYIMKQGEPGDRFYLLEDGEAYAEKSPKPGDKP